MILQTKLFAPTIQPQTVTRPALLQRLIKHSGHLLLVAPAGFGKTTLITQWVAQTPKKVAWLSLDAMDNTPLRFWQYLLATLSQAGLKLELTLTDPLPKPDLLLTPIINALMGQNMILVLDDYHLLTEPHIHEGMRFLSECVNRFETTR